MALLEVKNIYKSFGGVKAIQNFSIEANAGEIHGIIGPNGAGKTTIFNTISGVYTADQGSVLLDGQDIYAMNAEQLAQVRRQKIGFIFQDFRLFPEYTVRDNILIPFYLDHRTPDEQMLHKLTGILGIAGKLHSRPAQLSGGQQQRVAIARALIAKPRIVFADEPTGNLDTRTGEDTMRLLMECAAEFGQTLIVVTHNPEIAQKAQQVIRIEDGRIFYSAILPMSVRSRGDSGV